MDRPISSKEKRNQKLKWFAIIFITSIAAVAGLQFLLAKMRPQLNRKDLLVGTIDRGSVHAAIETTGTLVPEQEMVLTAPGETRILSVVRKPGSMLTKGDPILQLDTSKLQLDRDGFAQQLGVKENIKQQTLLKFEKEQRQRHSKLELIELDLRYFEAALKQQRLLFEQGLVSKESLQQATLQFEKKQVEKRQQLEERESAKESFQVEIKGFNIEIDLLRKSLAGAEALLKRATTHAPTSGVLTWVVEGEGRTVRSGEPLAKIANLSNLKVNASISDFYADRIQTHQEAIIQIGDKELPGKISRLLPEVTNGTMSFEIKLLKQSNMSLKPNQRVSVFILTTKRDAVLRVRRTSLLARPGKKNVYVLRGGTAIKTPIQVGVTGTKYTEILEGLAEGEQLILDELIGFQHLNSIPIK